MHAAVKHVQGVEVADFWCQVIGWLQPKGMKTKHGTVFKFKKKNSNFICSREWLGCARGKRHLAVADVARHEYKAAILIKHTS